MKYKKTLFILIFVVFLFSIAGVSASDANSTILDSGNNLLTGDADSEIMQLDANDNQDVETHEQDVGDSPLKEDNTPISDSQSDDESSEGNSIILRAAIPKITAEKKTCELTNKPVKYRITLKDSFDSPIGNEKVTLKIEGKVYSAVTNGKGIATFKITNLNKKGKFKASIKFDGNEYYKKTSVKGKIVVKDTFSTISKNSRDKSAVRNVQQALKDNGYYITYKGHYLKVDGWYGPCTFRSVKQFQKANKLKVTGKVDYKTASKLNMGNDKSNKVVIKFVGTKTPNADIMFENNKTFKGEYNSGESFPVWIFDKSTGKPIETSIDTDYFQNGKLINSSNHYEGGISASYYMGEDGNEITPENLDVGTYKVKVSCSEPGINAIPKYKKIIITKTSINIKVKYTKLSGNKLKLKVFLSFKNNAEVNEGKVKITSGANSYTVKVRDGVVSKKITINNPRKVTVKYLGDENIKPKTVTVRIN